MSKLNNPLSPTVSEKKILRSHKVKFSDLHTYSVKEVRQLLSTSLIRAMELHAISEFQNIPSIGPAFAHDLISLGFYSLKDLKKKDPAKLIDRLEARAGAWIDPCVEDQFRLVVYTANHPHNKKNWWDFTEERKKFRSQHGYPKDRPAKAWYDLPGYRREERVEAKAEVTRKDIASKLKEAMGFIKKHYTEAISLEQLATTACLSLFHFQRNFTAVYEKSPLEVITHLRLKKACLLLKKSGLTIESIAIRCGFEDTSSFIRLFKRTFGDTPAGFRKQFKSEIRSSLIYLDAPP
ncbi:MAG TPA: helix-hairpin-helix domain-containing protein [Puia sp.]|nr:helix-hairpin-helix domain-containing protein [Puia sp.]